MKIALVQLESVKGAIDQNIAEHLQWIRKAGNLGATLLIFPELSITGYDSSMAASLAMEPTDPRLTIFQKIAVEEAISIAVGLPLQTTDKPRIALLVFRPEGSVTVLSKQYLHEDELPFFRAGEAKEKLLIETERIAVAICYEFFVDAHTAAVVPNASIFIASVAKSGNGMERAAVKASVIAKQYSIPILICNSIGPVEDYIAVGGTAAWSSTGQKLGAVPAGQAGLLLFDTSNSSMEIVI